LYIHKQEETRGIQQPPNIGRRKPICNCQKIRVIESQKVNTNPKLPQSIPSHILKNLQLFSIIFEGKIETKGSQSILCKRLCKNATSNGYLTSHLQVFNDSFCIAHSTQDNAWTKLQYINTRSAVSNQTYSFRLAQIITREKPIKDIITVCKS